MAQGSNNRGPAPLAFPQGRFTHRPALHSYVGLRSSSLQLAHAARAEWLITGGRGRRSLRVHALFEKFTERSIKSVMLAQEEARRLLSAEVGARLPALESHRQQGAKGGPACQSTLRFELPFARHSLHRFRQSTYCLAS